MKKLNKSLKITTASLIAFSPFASSVTTFATDSQLPYDYEYYQAPTHEADYLYDFETEVDYEFVDEGYEVEIDLEVDFMPLNNGTISTPGGSVLTVGSDHGSQNLRISTQWEIAGTYWRTEHFPEHARYATSNGIPRNYRNNFTVTHLGDRVRVESTTASAGHSIWLYFLPNRVLPHFGSLNNRSGWQRVLVSSNGAGTVYILPPSGGALPQRQTETRNNASIPSTLRTFPATAPFENGFRVTEGKISSTLYNPFRPAPEAVLPPSQDCGKDTEWNEDSRTCESTVTFPDLNPSTPDFGICPEGQLPNPDADYKCEEYSDETFYCPVYMPGDYVTDDKNKKVQNPEWNPGDDKSDKYLREPGTWVEGDCELPDFNPETNTPEIDEYIPVNPIPGIVIAPDDEEGFYNVNVDGENDRGVNEDGEIDIYIPNTEDATCSYIKEVVNLPDDWDFEIYHPPYGEGDYIRITVTGPPGYSISEEDETRRKYLVPIPTPGEVNPENNRPTRPWTPSPTPPSFPSFNNPGNDEPTRNEDIELDVKIDIESEEIVVTNHRQPGLPQTGTVVTGFVTTSGIALIAAGSVISKIKKTK